MKVRFLGLTVAASLVALVGLLLTQSPATGEDKQPEYVGAKKCKMCHIKEYKSWEKTSMASSLDTLKPGHGDAAKKKAGLDPAKDYSADPKCIACHTTGHGHPGGFVSEKETPELAFVGCEACHGPGSEYLGPMKEHKRKKKTYTTEEYMQMGLIKPDKDNCMSCHKEEGNPFFKPLDVEAAKKEVHGK